MTHFTPEIVKIRKL